MGPRRQYAAFLSYAHADEGIAERVHKALETYPIPRALKAVSQGKLSPIFRDVTEFTAHHSLTEKIQNAVQNSRYLIVLCSKASKDSHWVNEEIRLFRRLHGEDSILCALLEGTPITSFPPALTEGGREPLAADLTGAKESFKFGITQMAAAMLGVGLDELVQREARRKRVRNGVISMASLAFSAVMGVMAWTAIDARDEAETSRTEAEKMVEYMLTDLKGELDKVGRLSILDAVGDRVTDYYDAIPLSDMDDDRLARQARARHLLGEVAVTQANFKKATRDVSVALEITQKLKRRAPNNSTFKLAHALSEYWSAYIYLQNNLATQALPHAKKYLIETESLFLSDSRSLEVIFNHARSHNTLGHNYYLLKDYEASIGYYNNAINLYERGLETYPDSVELIYNRAISRRNLAVSFMEMGEFTKAISSFSEQISILNELLQSDPNNMSYLDSRIIAKIWLSRTNMEKYSVCYIIEIKEIVNELEGMVELDSSNQHWLRDYVDYLYRALSNCSSEIPSEWAAEKLNKVNEIYNLIENKSPAYEKMKDWLEKLEPSLLRGD